MGIYTFKTSMHRGITSGKNKENWYGPRALNYSGPIYLLCIPLGIYIQVSYSLFVLLVSYLKNFWSWTG